MSNEYKDYMQDSAIDVVLEKKMVDCIHYVIEKAPGYYIVGSDDIDLKVYFVWLDDNGKWQYEKQLIHNFSKNYNNGYKDGYEDGRKITLHDIENKIKTMQETIDALRDYNDQLLSEIQSIRGYI